MVTDPQLKPKSLTLLWANTSIYLTTPFLTWSCRALRRLLTAGNRSVSAEKRCGSSVSTPFTPMVSTDRKRMTNFPLFSLLFSFPTEFYIYFTCIFYICSTFVLFCLLVYLLVLFDTHFLIITSSSINSWYLSSHFNLLCMVSGPAPDSAFSIFFFCVHFTPN